MLKYHRETNGRLEATRDIGKIVAKGWWGGKTEFENNLSQEGNCWITKDARAWDNSKILDNALLLNTAGVYENSVVKDNAKIYSNAVVRGNSIIGGNVHIGHSSLVDDCVLSGDFSLTFARIKGSFDYEIINFDTFSVLKYKVFNGKYVFSYKTFSGTFDKLLEQAKKKFKPEDFKKWEAFATIMRMDNDSLV